jgi:dTDP-4-dehydrorhamnose 3,5-epimerase-like enzyme
MSENQDVIPHGVEARALSVVQDLRGTLAIAESDNTGFSLRRVFFVSQVGQGLFRGAHAHRECEQILFPVQGTLSCSVDDGRKRVVIDMNSRNLALRIPPMVWASQFNFEVGSVLAVFASHEYDPDDYIRDYQAFRDNLGAE